MKKIILPIIALLIALSAFSQSKKDRIKALKVSFITERLELTQEEAQKFWPVYNAYDDITGKIKYEDLRNIRREIKNNIATLTDKRASELLEEIASAENKLHEEEVKLNVKLKKIISPKKILLLKIAEEDFKKKLFDQWKKMKHDGKKP
ncbi:sensor of ECF-type sigma factor [Sabulilitoribacter multivorans]|uniref:Sensor of ECF-type sigma factor n=1 Tax=Flaviramulus multivorans TaxID=1304750 RepID=A0ABS9IL88_9FLAO|nr:sensor of ECF-type sigma factor [Flaviramulus multivorans]MCF7561359.1 sensor of ECF-type sigma factor [Flaviramulus multivorans]